MIDEQLVRANASVRWTIIGDGPKRFDLMQSLPPSLRVTYASPASNAEVLALCAQGDVLVFPTRFEGFPVALLEAMSAGLVPVVSDLPSGVPEVVDSETGFRVEISNVGAFVSAVLALHNNHELLESMSRAACRRAAYFDIDSRAQAYHDLFSRAKELKRPWRGPMALKHGSRLDQPYLPNCLVKTVRKTLRIARAHVS